jgi:DNA mismatch repair ATPase MutS
VQADSGEAASGVRSWSRRARDSRSAARRSRKGRCGPTTRLDELFQGTNSQDRRVGAEAVLRILIDSGAIGMVTTHDLALTEIADRVGPVAANVHFEDRYEKGAMVFDYRLRPGVAQSSNGLALLRAVGIEV